MPGAAYVESSLWAPCFARQPLTWKFPFGRHVLGFQFSFRHSSESGVWFRYRALSFAWKVAFMVAMFGWGDCSAVISVTV